MGRPIIQYPQDIVAMQELIWSVEPDLPRDGLRNEIRPLRLPLYQTLQDNCPLLPTGNIVPILRC